MKRRILLTVFLCVCLALGASALSLDGYNLNIEIESDFSVLTADKIASENDYVTSLGHTVQSAKKYFSDNGLILFASNDDNTRQIQIKCTETDFSKQLGDLSLLSNDGIFEIADNLLPSGQQSGYGIVEVNGMSMLEVSSLSADSGGSFCGLQYITIRGGRLYSIGFFENGTAFTADFSAIAEKCISSLSIAQSGTQAVKTAENLAEVIIVWLLIIAAAAVSVAIFVSIMVEIAGKKNTDEKRAVITRRRLKK